MELRPLVCASLTRVEDVEKANEADLVEVRIDLLGPEWRRVVPLIEREWIACNRRIEEGGAWRGSEEDRVRELMEAVDLGASMVDLELRTARLRELVQEFKARGVKCIVSRHVYGGTTPIERLKAMVAEMVSSGADVWKLAAEVRRVEDNFKLLELLREFEKPGIVVGMGDLGALARLLSPLLGGFLTYAAISRESRAAPGQLTLDEMRRFYRLMGVDA